jgi:hypothetical protein
VQPLAGRVWIAIALVSTGVPACRQSLRADVVVLANRSREDVRLWVEGAAAEGHQIRSDDLLVLPAAAPMTVEFTSNRVRAPQRHLLQTNRCYYLGETDEGTVRLAQIDLGETGGVAPDRSWSHHSAGAATGWISVKILVDDDEPARRPLWEKRLRERVEMASQILQQHCRLGLRVVAVDTWTSDNDIHDFGETLREFERKVQPQPARLAIGFSSQYEIPDGRMHLGGTRGPLARHILVREWSQHIPEPQRVELLLHELGHHLGAAHSPEPESVMRPVLLRPRSRGQRFPLRFDPLNTLAMYLVGEEVRYRRVDDFSELTSETDALLRLIYTALDQTVPGDGAAQRYAARLGREQIHHRAAGRGGQPLGPNPLIEATRQVVQAVVREATLQTERPNLLPGGGPQNDRTAESGSEPTVEGDRVTEALVRAAARQALVLPESQGPRALVLGLGISLDDSLVLRQHPRTRDFVVRVEPDSRRSERLDVVGRPTMHGRRDLLQHFAVAGYLASVTGAEAARSAGQAKEWVDAHRASGFSMADLAANEAGILFATGLSSGQIDLTTVADGFLVAQYVPSPAGLREGLTANQLSELAAGNPDAVRNLFQAVRDRVGQMPVYRAVRLP